MPTYDARLNRVVVRVVYDGVAYAGKTTNIAQLSALFAFQRAPVHTPSELRGRTLFFDWLQLQAGSVCGYPLLCQVLTVPGQAVLAPRRRHLLETADVIVHVCESTEASLEPTRAALEPCEEIRRARGVPVVLQANKQDRPGALDGPTLGRALGVSPVVFEAIASDGIGVVDTFVAAVRAAVRAVQDDVEGGAARRLVVRRAETPADALARIAAVRLDPSAGAELLLEEAQAALELQTAARSVARDAPARDAAREVVAALGTDAGEPITERPRAPAPPPPRSDVPTGFVWPAHTGRAILERLAGVGPRPLAADGTVVLRGVGHSARTRGVEWYEDREAARQALVRAARSRTQLGALLAPDTVLVAQPDERGGCWLWTIVRDLPSVAGALGSRPRVAAAYGAAAAVAARAALRHGFSLELGPDRFGLEGDEVRYVGDLVATAPSPDAVADAARAAVDAVERAGADPAAFVDAFERELGHRSAAHDPHERPASSAGDRARAAVARACEAS